VNLAEFFRRHEQREAEKRRAADLGLPIPGTGRPRRCGCSGCDWCVTRMRWNRSTERAQVRREVMIDRD
jgi:hypothetical protein